MTEDGEKRCCAECGEMVHEDGRECVFLLTLGAVWNYYGGRVDPKNCVCPLWRPGGKG